MILTLSCKNITVTSTLTLNTIKLSGIHYRLKCLLYFFFQSTNLNWNQLHVEYKFTRVVHADIEHLLLPLTKASWWVSFDLCVLSCMDITICMSRYFDVHYRTNILLDHQHLHIFRNKILLKINYMYMYWTVIPCFFQWKHYLTSLQLIVVLKLFI